MLTIAVSSLAGGQGKTTTALFLGKLAAQAGYSVLMVDGDPQANLTTWLGVFPGDKDPTLLEVLKETIAVDQGIYEVEDQKNLFLIPSDRSLNQAQDYLANSGYAAAILRQRLEPLKDDVDLCIVDSPPQRSQLCLTAIGAADKILIPVEANLKGFGSLQETVGLIEAQSKYTPNKVDLLGFIPFRDKWVGYTQTKESREAVFNMVELAGLDKLLPSVRESEQFKRAINHQSMPDGEMLYPFQEILKKLKPLIKKRKAVKA